MVTLFLLVAVVGGLAVAFTPVGRRGAASLARYFRSLIFESWSSPSSVNDDDFERSVQLVISAVRGSVLHQLKNGSCEDIYAIALVPEKFYPALVSENESLVREVNRRVEEIARDARNRMHDRRSDPGRPVSAPPIYVELAPSANGAWEGVLGRSIDGVRFRAGLQGSSTADDALPPKSDIPAMPTRVPPVTPMVTRRRNVGALTADLVVDGSLIASRAVEPGEDLWIGRGNETGLTVPPRFDLVSRRHVRVRIYGVTCQVMDHSANGAWVLAPGSTAPTALHAGAECVVAVGSEVWLDETGLVRVLLVGDRTSA